ncbi:MAG: DUF2334 domain-containing protein [Candidatus Pacearchaeota archaeon]|nr:DUF2334 domain-containing protein [Candidatus Pacearchaeota archaeon]
MIGKIFVSFLIITLVFIMCVRSLNYIIQDVQTNTYENNCGIIEHSTSERNIVIRIDDIQAYYLKDVQIRMIKDALAINRTVSLGVIPINLASDMEMFNFLKEVKCELEISLHGYNNSENEFSNILYQQANEKIRNGLEVLRQIQPEIITFIPPNNEISDAGREAVYDNGIKIISSGFVNREFGFSVSTYDWKNHKFVNYKEVLQECSKELDKGEICVIMIHPQDYVTNGKLDVEKYDQYIKLLNAINSLNAKVVTFRDLYYQGRINLN